ncbi:alpha-L-fucosidase [Paenibacillus mucilaginosus]|uniref:alpha-L-fucosidase n=3 Tax=Paenibacillus mucilaginosus TaxID=61624 RepID=H6NLK6_9BACL|nr:alpha-L-fucosidase [Paenibacillus mucilaginosus]AEI43281.1 Alpha-L-fucosidase [Paenibacillus mucilaginosus KNP414]AFC30940.1 alpha-L-fucosidase [Paenibacillus mucilaginosus 3016]AFH63261.1 alpha-L-fucosidase [Paenibacillus mucilaginosus K02]MCG7212164.1 alpha-L-fucosidase [Paenibacillus mucilaginosus]WDM24864.1 alpha-L-fucosidase [Paenibacillus mucilaginosus]
MTYDVQPTTGDSEWFTQDRFGLFIHWGLYSLGARHEWLQSREKSSTEAYGAKYFKRFDPDLYDPELWAQLAQDAGMTYFVATTKHHEGFCLWDSELTGFKAPNTPAGRDVLRPMVDAFRGRGMKVGFYYSLLDWNHPHYTVDPKHPLRENAAFIEESGRRDFSLYRDYLYGQTEELLTRFGKIDLLFYDFSFPGEGGLAGKGKDDWGSEALVRRIRELQPQILLNDRLQVGGDITTPEQYIPKAWVNVNGRKVVWETCHTFSGSWGYHREESSWKSVEMLVKMLIDVVSKGGNLLLNVGPTGRGEFDERAVDRLKGIGTWMRRHSRAIYGCTQAPESFPCPPDCRLTYNPQTNRMYLHVYSWPFRNIHLPGFAGKVEYAQLLHDASEIRMKEGFVASGIEEGAFREGRDETTLTLSIPVKQPDVTVPVIELFLK